MLKVLYFRSSFDPGGTETLLLNLFNFKQNRLKLYYFLFKEGKYVARLKSEQNKYVVIKRKHAIDFRLLYNILQLIIKEKISIIHTHQLIELIYGCIIKILYPRLNLFHTIHLNNDKNDWKFKLEKLLVNLTQVTFVVSESQKNELITRGYNPQKLIVLYNAVLNIYRNKGLIIEERIQKFKKLIKYKNRDIIIGMIGNFISEKDQLCITKAFNQLSKQYLNLKLVFVGNKNDIAQKSEEIVDKRLIGNRIFFTGVIENASEIISLYDLLIMSSVRETFGIVIIEALLQKVPVLASNIDVFKELSNQGSYFKHFKTSNVKDLVNKIKSFIELSEKNEQYYSYDKSYDYVASTYSYDEYVKKLERIYTKHSKCRR